MGQPTVTLLAVTEDPIVPTGSIDVTIAAEPQEPPRRRRGRLPLGGLTLLALVVVVGGVLLLNRGDDPLPTVPELGSGFPSATGQPAADFSVELLDGTPFRLSDHLEDDGRPVVLNLWASWCAPCRAEMPALDATAAAHPEVFILGVAVEDDPVAAAEFGREIGVSYALAVDDGERVGRRYPSPGLPATFFISSDGSVVRTVFGEVNQAQMDRWLAESFGG